MRSENPESFFNRLLPHLEKDESLSHIGSIHLIPCLQGFFFLNNLFKVPVTCRLGKFYAGIGALSFRLVF